MTEWLRNLLSDLAHGFWGTFLEKPVEHIARRVINGEFNELFKDAARIVIPIILIFAVLDILINLGWFRKPSSKKPAHRHKAGRAEKERPYFGGKPEGAGRVKLFLARLAGRGRVEVERIIENDDENMPDPELWPGMDGSVDNPAQNQSDAVRTPIELDLDTLRSVLAGEVMEMDEREAQEALDEHVIVLGRRRAYAAAESRRGRLRKVQGGGNGAV